MAAGREAVSLGRTATYGQRDCAMRAGRGRPRRTTYALQRSGAVSETAADFLASHRRSPTMTTPCRPRWTAAISTLHAPLPLSKSTPKPTHADKALRTAHAPLPPATHPAELP